ncbi:MAG: type II toxin-antitoxin system PemK/MazF family toxin [Candidatus Paceibacterota bacterium]
MKKDFDKWNELKKRTDNLNVITRIREGEVRWCIFGINIGNEIIGKGEFFRRPALILKKYSGDVFLGLPLTTREHYGDWYYEIIDRDLSRFVILNQGRILDRKRLAQKIFEISEIELENVKIAYCSLIMKQHTQPMV